MTMNLKFPPQNDEQFVHSYGHIYRSHLSQFYGV